MRNAVQITGAALLAAVLMTGCSSSSGDDKNVGQDTTAPAKQPTTPASSAPAVPAGSVDGAYAAQTGEGPVGLSLVGGKAAVASEGGKRLCNGTNHGTSIDVKCPDGSTKRTKGTIEKAEGTTLVVAWEGGPKDTFTRKGDAPKLPDTAKLPDGAKLPDPSKLGH
ncbi:hypothetical protein AB0K09_15935 [Streptomyces sp. NPDC049577]|uniref:hypothetical protein n=1 Tax=Streptomyces sp. NPDC049577 TaxID=3155153 RepID=UPI0034303D26